MATVIDVSSRLGEYMLKGWVLTDAICPQCGKVPMMRSPSAAAAPVRFCVNCDPTPGEGTAAAARGSRPFQPPSSVPAPADASSASTVSYETHISRSSTPPTDISSAPGSPLLAPIMDTAELLRRRQQSDTASAEIGRRMLKGWAMLADECPNPNCYGIPLVRPPKVQSAIDPRKECVICGIVYVDEKDILGQDRLVPIQSVSSPADTYRPPAPPAAGSSTSAPLPVDKGKGKARSSGASLDDLSRIQPAPHVVSEQRAPNLRSSTSSALEVSARSLEQSLLALSARLDSLSSPPILDPTPIGQTADSIAKVAEALTQVKKLLWSENQARIA